MKTLIVIVLMLACAMSVAAPQVLVAEQPPAGIVDGGNKLCPVSGDPVSGSDFVIYQGKRYGLCCPMCKGPFLSDPAKYIAKMVKQEATQASTATVTPVAAKSMGDMGKKAGQSDM